MKKYYAESELIINPDGSIFHLHIKPEQLANKIILVGDPGRVALVASHFDTKECEIESREFKTITGTYKGKRLTVVSTGIGCDNIDIVMNELDALANIDFNTRYEKDHLRQLELVRIGTCGGLQPYTPVGTYVCSEKSIGFDGLLNFYAGRNEVCDLKLEQAFIDYMGWEGNVCIAHPYVIDADRELIDRIAQNDMVRGVTIAAGGFFGPQGRELRIPLADPKQNEKIEKFEYNDYRITNFEMESSALAGLARLMGQKNNKMSPHKTNKNMETSFKQTTSNKVERYRLFLPQFELLISDEKEEISVLANTAAALREAFGFFWVGFYLVKDDQLILGPFQGSTACYRIHKGKGVCGTSWAEARTLIVPNVEQFPGHIACSSLSRSEIVVPILANGQVKGVLDIDSNLLNFFDETDRRYLEEVTAIVAKTLYY